MGYTARWRNKGFIISPYKVVALENLKTSFGLDTQNNMDTSGTPSTNTLGRKLQEITLETTYARALGTNPRAQLDEWDANVGGYDTLYIQGKPFGADKMQLINVDVSDIKLTAAGEFLSVRVALTFREYQPQAAAISTKKPTGKATDQSQSKSTAMNAKPTADDKALRAVNYSSKLTTRD